MTGREYANGLINNAAFNAMFLPLFRNAGFTCNYAKERFADIVFNPFAEELLQVNHPDVFIVTSSPDYFVQQFATKFDVPETNVICSRYSFDSDGLVDECVAPCGISEKASFVEHRTARFSTSLGIGGGTAVRVEGD